MGNFEEALRRLSRLDAEAESRKPAPGRDPLSPAVLQGATYYPGDVVRDVVTGEEVQVVDSRFVHATFTAPEH
jgi:hypothetical protein